MLSILDAYHSSPVGGHHSGIQTAHYTLQCWSYRSIIDHDAHEFEKSFNYCKREDCISTRWEFPKNPIFFIEYFDVWVIEFMVHLWVHIGWSIFFLRLIMCKNLWKPWLLKKKKGRALLCSYKRAYFLDLAPQGRLLVIGGPTFATSCSMGYWRNMGFPTMCPLLIILRLVGNFRCQTEKSSRFC